ncbi:chain length determinant protein EpsF [Sideroxydans sp. CL21]|uniref:chain length determinant protein EpsF n=1 Tax=Sideroxydans sp. CL21 TaxID=2600596 RepID=UPI0024BD070A|nr:chain length determinant protein EpsF [Sideroxydans sp. CL21]
MNIHQFLIILLARYKIALYVLLATVTVAFAVTLLMPDKYVASTSVLLDVKTPDPLVGMAMAGMAMPSYMATQTDIITSERVAQGAVKLLKLDESPQVREQWRKATQGKGQLVTWLGSLLSKKLEVKPSRDSNVIDISFSSDDPAFAAVAANAFAQAYINTNLELKVEPARQYAQWFQVKVATLRSELENAQSRLSAYQKQTGLVSTDIRMQNVESTKIAELSGQLVVSEGQTADTESKKKHAGTGDTLADVMQNPVILSLKSELIKQEGKLQEASLNLGQNNPQYQAMESQIASLKQKMAEETKKILDSINTANSVNMQKRSELKAAIESHKQQVMEDSGQRDQIAVLERDVESAQKAYDTVVQRYTESNLQSQSNQTNITVLTPASEPLARSSPSMFKNLLIAVFMGTLLGVGGAFVAEMLDQRVRTGESLGSATGVPVLVQFKKDSKPLGIRGWMKKMAGAVKIRPRFRKAVTVV